MYLFAVCTLTMDKESVYTASNSVEVEVEVEAEAATTLGAASEGNEPSMHPTEAERSVNAPLFSALYPSAAARLSACCHGGAKMAVLAYSLGKREINQYFSIKNAKVLSLVAVILLTVFHSASRYYGGKLFGGKYSRYLLWLRAVGSSLTYHVS